MASNSILATAHHEAGHTVAAYHLVLPFTGAALKQRSYFERRTITAFAGRIAEEKFRGRKARWGYGGDYESIADVALKFGGYEEDTHVHWCRWLHAQSKALVEFRWKEVQAIAKELLKNGSGCRGKKCGTLSVPFTY